MRSKLFIATYNRPQELDQNLTSLIELNQQNLEIYIINNHTNFSCKHVQVKTLHNVARPNFSTGHLARNWNQALLHGFVNLQNPDCELVITCQDDTIWLPHAFDKIFALLEKYDFITDGPGDNLCIYRPQAIKKIGLWDERFCNIGYQEADYFLRAAIYYPEKSSINDHSHGRLHNPHNLEIIRHPQLGFKDESHLKSLQYHPYTAKLFANKWGIRPDNWQFPLPKKSLIQNYIFYPYFELEIENLQEKNYLTI